MYLKSRRDVAQLYCMVNGTVSMKNVNSECHTYIEFVVNVPSDVLLVRLDVLSKAVLFFSAEWMASFLTESAGKMEG